MHGYQKGNKLIFANDRIIPPGKDPELLVDIDRENTAIYINGQPLDGVGDPGNVEGAALKDSPNTFTGLNIFTGGIELQDSPLTLKGSSKIASDQIIFESDSIMNRRQNGDGVWENYTSVDSGNIQNYATTPETLTAELEHYVTTDQTIELINNHIAEDTLAKEVIIEVPAGATEGTLTVEQLTTLQSGDANFIMFDHEKYYLNDKGSTEGYLTYSHTGYANNAPVIKTITITISTRGWVLHGVELNNASIKYITIEQPASATNGSLSAEDVVTLQTSKSNKIIFDNEIYSLQDNQHESGYLIYSHVGHNSTGNFMIKCITVTITTGGWALNSYKLPAFTLEGDTLTING